ncbi:capsule synthesis protein, capa [Pavlovales sp. CCMP2436]|nr:capsule synthesis protein, capa [Pavlovales sp. CCMP2436]
MVSPRSRLLSFAPVCVFLCGDVMLGRGIDQVMQLSCDPVLYESHMRSALGYVRIAEEANGPIPRKMDSVYVWGDFLEVLERVAPDVRIINLETAVSESDEYWEGKGINYRLHPANVNALARLRVDIVALANNHMLNWGCRGLAKTLKTLADAGIRTAGAGVNRKSAAQPAVVLVGDERRVLVYSVGSTSAGVPLKWAATVDRPGVWMLDGPVGATVSEISQRVKAVNRTGDMLTHALIDHADVDVVHGHSSHHPRAVEIYGSKLILYGRAGNFINNYEGIWNPSWDGFRSDLTRAYFPVIDSASGKLIELTMRPLQMHRFRLRNASVEDAAWLTSEMDRECRKFGARVKMLDKSDGGGFVLALEW